jgi:hypothetical protein
MAEDGRFEAAGEIGEGQQDPSRCADDEMVYGVPPERPIEYVKRAQMMGCEHDTHHGEGASTRPQQRQKTRYREESIGPTFDTHRVTPQLDGI